MAIVEAFSTHFSQGTKVYGREPGAFWTDQLNNTDMEAGYHPMGEVDLERMYAGH